LFQLAQLLPLVFGARRQEVVRKKGAATSG
jgi:hypothetical protein